MRHVSVYRDKTYSVSVDRDLKPRTLGPDLKRILYYLRSPGLSGSYRSFQNKEQPTRVPAPGAVCWFTHYFLCNLPQVGSYNQSHDGSLGTLPWCPPCGERHIPTEASKGPRPPGKTRWPGTPNSEAPGVGGPCTHEDVLLSRDHFLICESLLIRKMPFPWALPQGFMIQVLEGLFLNSSTNRL